ncbi:probable SAC1-recessive suppressor of secretory defect [Serendipita indica DSM 11827]|uniref:Probable SAC1-recessive suppressor of secretory defect n=1 Tax=Serendipita indica (strain DSM 11827) TaxID=1109443 RepID=G4T741_SERID|nr:probable SAC1-recessive suppressor of secretory defect [Serendipita indica DSM 11827]
MTKYSLHDRLQLWATGDKYAIEPVGTGELPLTIDRHTGEITLEPLNKDWLQSATVMTIYGIMGILKLSTSDFLVLITDRKSKGKLLGKDIYQATDYKVLPIASGASVSQILGHPIEKQLLGLIHSHLFSATFIFSYEWDVTRRMQAQLIAANDDAAKAPWQAADLRFFWNYHLSRRLMQQASVDLGRFILPVIYGTCEINYTEINGQRFQFVLMSRRSRFRAGTRYFTRGIDADGHVGNYNETEQIVVTENNSKTAFVQTRGSIPLFWAEVNNLAYIPDMQVMERPDAISALRLHLEEQVSLYGSQSLVNLVNSKGHEQQVKEGYEKNVALASVPSVQYHHFDFHKECRHMRWDRISILLDRLAPELEEKGFFHVTLAGGVQKWQMGVVRTNCMDNLDRTNVVQSSIAKWSLSKQLQELGILSEGETVEQHEQFMSLFRHVWADHADAISTAYSGTGALKTDFTRTGKRTRLGALQDFRNSAVRYIKNNYFDGPRQDAFDLFTGTWVPRGPSSAYALFFDPRPLHTRAMPYVMSFAIFMIFAGLTLPRTSGMALQEASAGNTDENNNADYSLTYYFLFWISVVTATFAYIRAHGVEYVSWPRLKRLDDVIYYTGPGYRSRKAPKPPSYMEAAKSAAARGRLTSARPYHLEEIEMGTSKRTE